MLLSLALLTAAACAAEAYTLNHGLDNLVYDARPSSPSVDPGETFEVITTVENRKLLPVSFLKIQETFPRELSAEEGISIRRDSEVARLSTSTFLKPRQRMEKRFKASLPQRGRYFLRGANLHAGDFLGLKQTSAYFPVNREIVVLPAPLDSSYELRALGDFLGDMSVNRFIMEDPVLTLGFREYTGREPQRAISWTQSARMGRTMVKNYDHTLDLSATVILNVEYPKDIDFRPELIEKCFSAGRTVCEALEAKRIKYGVLTNATSSGALGLWSQVGDGLGRSHLMSILEGLGRATYSCTMPFSRLADLASRKNEDGRYYVVITPVMTDRDALAISRLKALKGGGVHIIDASAIPADSKEDEDGNSDIS